MAILGRGQLNLSSDEREQLFLLSWTDMAGDHLRTELVEDGLITERGAQLFLTGLFDRLRGICRDVFEAEKTVRMVEAEPILSLDPKIATRQQREAASERLLRELTLSGGACVFAKYPPLRGLLDRLTERFIETGKEFFARLQHDRAEICRHFFGTEPFGLITRIICNQSDLHFHGRCTFVVEAEKGRFIYRPRDCRIDMLARKLVAASFSDYLKVPDCISCEGYGWCEYIVPNEIHSEAEAALFYRRFGGACALMHALGGSDLHSENWICDGGIPVLVDLETLLSPIPRLFIDKTAYPELIAENDGFICDVNHSLAPSCLLPAMIGDRQVSVLLDDSARTNCEPVLNGKKLTVRGFESDFLSGFAEGYDRCMTLRDDLLRAVGAFAGLSFRKLIRGTDGYAKLLTEINSVEALRGENGRQEAARKLDAFFRQHGAEHMLPIADWEKQCLLEGDIPYFSSIGDGHALLGYGNVVVEDFFRLSAVENAREHIERLSCADKLFELALLSQGIRRAVILAGHQAADIPPVGPTVCQLSELRPLSREAALAEAEALFRLIDEMMLTGPSGKSSWMAFSEHNMSIAPARPTFARGTAGLGAFFAAMYAAGCGSSGRAADLSDICLAQLKSSLDQLEKARQIPENALALGISNGIAGAFRALGIMESCLKNGSAGALSLRLLQLLDKVEIEQSRQLDVYSGVAGLLIELCRIYRKSGTKLALPHIRRCAERLLRGRILTYRGRLLWDTCHKKRPISGSGHGMAGIADALSWASVILGDSRCREAACAALDFEHGIYSKKLGNWPDLRNSPVSVRAMQGLCSGAPGVGLALLRCRENGLGSPELDEDIERAKLSCMTIKPVYRDHLCCGNSSTVDFLLSVSGCQEQAGRLLAFMKSRKDNEGSYRFMPPVYRQVPCLDLFFGAAGIGYEMLRYVGVPKLEQIMF